MAVQFARTTKEIAEYIGRTYKKQPGDTKRTIMKMELFQNPVLSDLEDGATRNQEKIHE